MKRLGCTHKALLGVKDVCSWGDCQGQDGDCLDAIGTLPTTMQDNPALYSIYKASIMVRTKHLL